jgi:hypothetical protein
VLRVEVLQQTWKHALNVDKAAPSSDVLTAGIRLCFVQVAW